MPDVEKVVSKLQILRTWCAVNPDYDTGLSAEDCVKAVGWLDNAIALLKAQEPVEPKKNYVELAGLRTWDWACPECNCILTYRANYCSCCGHAVKWE